MPKQPLILIVDDNPNNLQILGKLLTAQGYDLSIAQCGEDALQSANETLPDLILLDIMMPGMDGYEVCRKLKEDMATRHIPLIFLTAKIGADEIIKGFDLGAADYVTKPFNVAELLARVRVHIELNTLRGILPVCSQCKKIRDDEGIWNQIEEYIENHSKAQFSHSLCPHCMDELYGAYKWYQNRKQPRQD
ncbi:MAG: response regulator [Geopsychrobacter sp.]|nr:response regulator [Geopsychrobacter sp.]